MKRKFKMRNKILSIFLCVAMLVASVPAMAFAAETDTRTVYLAFPGAYNNSVDTYVLSCKDAQDNQIKSITCTTTVGGGLVADLTTSAPVYLKADIPSDTVAIEVCDAENTGLFADTQLSSDDNVYVLSNNWESVTYAEPETLKVYTGYFKTVAEGETAIFVGESFSTTNYGTIIAGYFTGGTINHGVLTGGYYSGVVTNSAFGVIQGGSYSYQIKNSGKITGGVFSGDNSYGSWVTTIYNFEGGNVDAAENSGTTIIKSVNVTTYFENLTIQKGSEAPVSVSPYTDKTVPGETYSFTLVAKDGYAVPDSITLTIGGESTELFGYYVSEPTYYTDSDGTFHVIERPDDTTSPATSDYKNWLWCTFVLVCGAGAFGIIFHERKRRTVK